MYANLATSGCVCCLKGLEKGRQPKNKRRREKKVRERERYSKGA